MTMEMRDLARKFVAGELASEEFQITYIRLWSQHVKLVRLGRANEDPYDETILAAIHSACDVYRSNEQLIAEAPDIYINAEQLRKEMEDFVRQFHS